MPLQLVACFLLLHASLLNSITLYSESFIFLSLEIMQAIIMIIYCVRWREEHDQLVNHVEQ